MISLVSYGISKNTESPAYCRCQVGKNVKLIKPDDTGQYQNKSQLSISKDTINTLKERLYDQSQKTASTSSRTYPQSQAQVE